MQRIWNTSGRMEQAEGRQATIARQTSGHVSVKPQMERRRLATPRAEIERGQYSGRESAVVIAKVMSARMIAADAERNSLSAVIIFCATGLLLSLGIILLDQYIPGDWF